MERVSCLFFPSCNRLLVTVCGDETVDQTLSTWQESLYSTPLVSDAGVQSSEHLLKGVRFQAASLTKLPRRASGSAKGGGLCVYCAYMFVLSAGFLEREMRMFAGLSVH